MPTEPRILPMTGNLRAAMWQADDNPRAVIIYFQAREQTKPVCFRVTTSATILSSFWRMPSLQGGHWLTHSESSGPNHYAIAFGNHMFLDQPFIVGVELDTNDDPRDHVLKVETWDKTDAYTQTAYIEFPGAA